MKRQISQIFVSQARTQMHHGSSITRPCGPNPPKTSLLFVHPNLSFLAPDIIIARGIPPKTDTIISKNRE
jgi:hypothetical protein